MATGGTGTTFVAFTGPTGSGAASIIQPLIRIEGPTGGIDPYIIGTYNVTTTNITTSLPIGYTGNYFVASTSTGTEFFYSRNEIEADPSLVEPSASVEYIYDTFSLIGDIDIDIPAEIMATFEPYNSIQLTQINTNITGEAVNISGVSIPASPLRTESTLTALVTTPIHFNCSSIVDTMNFSGTFTVSGNLDMVGGVIMIKENSAITFQNMHILNLNCIHIENDATLTIENSGIFGGHMDDNGTYIDNDGTLCETFFISCPEGANLVIKQSTIVAGHALESPGNGQTALLIGGNCIIEESHIRGGNGMSGQQGLPFDAIESFEKELKDMKDLSDGWKDSSSESQTTQNKILPTFEWENDPSEINEDRGKILLLKSTLENLYTRRTGYAIGTGVGSTILNILSQKKPIRHLELRLARQLRKYPHGAVYARNLETFDGTFRKSYESVGGAKNYIKDVLENYKGDLTRRLAKQEASYVRYVEKSNSLTAPSRSKTFYERKVAEEPTDLANLRSELSKVDNELTNFDKRIGREIGEKFYFGKLIDNISNKIYKYFGDSNYFQKLYSSNFGRPTAQAVREAAQNATNAARAATRANIDVVGRQLLLGNADPAAVSRAVDALNDAIVQGTQEARQIARTRLNEILIAGEDGFLIPDDNVVVRSADDILQYSSNKNVEHFNRLFKESAEELGSTKTAFQIYNEATETGLEALRDTITKQMKDAGWKYGDEVLSMTVIEPLVDAFRKATPSSMTDATRIMYDLNMIRDSPFTDVVDRAITKLDTPLASNANELIKTIQVATKQATGEAIEKAAKESAEVVGKRAFKSIGKTLAKFAFVFEIFIELGMKLWAVYNPDADDDLFVDTSFSFTALVKNEVVGLLLDTLFFALDALAIVVGGVFDFFFYLDPKNSNRGNYLIEEVVPISNEVNNGRQGFDGGNGGYGLYITNTGTCRVLSSNIYGGNGGNGGKGSKGENGGYYTLPLYYGLDTYDQYADENYISPGSVNHPYMVPDSIIDDPNNRRILPQPLNVLREYAENLQRSWLRTTNTGDKTNEFFSTNSKIEFQITYTQEYKRVLLESRVVTDTSNIDKQPKEYDLYWYSELNTQFGKNVTRIGWKKLSVPIVTRYRLKQLFDNDDIASLIGPPSRSSGALRRRDTSVNGTNIFFGMTNKTLYTLKNDSSVFPHLNYEEGRPKYPFKCPDGGNGGRGGSGGNGSYAVFTTTNKLEMKQSLLIGGNGGDRGLGGDPGDGTSNRQVQVEIFNDGTKNINEVVKSSILRYVDTGKNGGVGKRGFFVGSNGFMVLQMGGKSTYVDVPLSWNDLRMCMNVQGEMTVYNCVSTGLPYMHAVLNPVDTIHAPTQTTYVEMCKSVPKHTLINTINGFVYTSNKFVNEASTLGEEVTVKRYPNNLLKGYTPNTTKNTFFDVRNETHLDTVSVRSNRRAVNSINSFYNFYTPSKSLVRFYHPSTNAFLRRDGTSLTFSRGTMPYDEWYVLTCFERVPIIGNTVITRTRLRADNGMFISTSPTGNSVFLTTTLSTANQWDLRTTTVNIRVGVRSESLPQYLGVVDGSLQMADVGATWTITTHDSYNTEIYPSVGATSHPDFTKKMLYTFLKQDVVTYARFPTWEYYPTISEMTSIFSDNETIHSLFTILNPSSTRTQFKLRAGPISSSCGVLVINNVVYYKNSEFIETDVITYTVDDAFPMFLLLDAATKPSTCSLQIVYGTESARAFEDGELKIQRDTTSTIMATRNTLIDSFARVVPITRTPSTELTVRSGVISLLENDKGYGIPTTLGMSTSFVVDGTTTTYDHKNVLVVSRDEKTLYNTTNTINTLVFKGVNATTPITVSNYTFSSDIELFNTYNIAFTNCTFQSLSLIGCNNITLSDSSVQIAQVNLPTTNSSLSLIECMNTTGTIYLHNVTASYCSLFANADVSIRNSTLQSLYAEEGPLLNMTGSYIHDSSIKKREVNIVNTRVFGMNLNNVTLSLTNTNGNVVRARNFSSISRIGTTNVKFGIIQEDDTVEVL